MMDLKMGTSRSIVLARPFAPLTCTNASLSADPLLPQAKRDAMAEKDNATTTVTLGLRVCGVRVRPKASCVAPFG